MKKHPRPIPLSSKEDLLHRLSLGSSLNLIISTTRECVLQCKYCYAIDPENLPSKRVLSVELLEKLIQDAFQVHHKHISFEWTGGEAMLAGQSFYEKVLEFQNKYAVPHKTYDNCMQTSGGIYNEGFIDFLLGNKFHLGLTIDGPRHIHEAQRPTKGGSSSFDTVLKTFEYIKKKRGNVACSVH